MGGFRISSGRGGGSAMAGGKAVQCEYGGRFLNSTRMGGKYPNSELHLTISFPCVFRNNHLTRKINYLICTGGFLSSVSPSLCLLVSLKFG